MTWADVNFRKFLLIKPGMPALDIIAILEDKTREQVGAERRDLERDLARMLFLNEPIPQTVWSGAPADLEQETIGQYEDFKATIKPDDLTPYPELYATFVTKDYDDKTTDKFKNMVAHLPCGQVIGTVNHYLKEVERIEAKWSPLYPKDGYTTEQRAAGFDQLAETFKFAGTVYYIESQCPFNRDEIVKWTVGHFKYYLLYLSRRSEVEKKYAEIQADGMRRKAKQK